MKKPILLLVDDDPAVLSALEAELAETFGDVLRIVAFEKALDVLAALPRWQAEHRPIAAAIVDQRMPEMTGVELIAALRAGARAEATPPPSDQLGTSEPVFHPARQMRAILLTGYAGLESAVAARNEANVDRYLEKPWTSSVLTSMLRKLLSRFLMESDGLHHLEFRELTHVDDIRRYMAMRYEAYAASPSLHYLLPQGARKKLDIDAYDTQSRFFGLFSVDGPEEALVGGLRLIGRPNPATQGALVAIASEDDVLRARAAKPTPYDIELPEKWPEPVVITRLLDQIRANGEAVIEAGRLVVVPTHRGRSLGSGPVVLGLYEGATTYVLEVIGVENVLQQCTQKHQAAATRMGFRLADGTGPMWNRRLQDTLVVLHGRESFLTNSARERMRCMGRGVAMRAHTCRCATFPSCLGDPYERDLFKSTDLFCPRLARELTHRDAHSVEPPVSATEPV